MNSKPFPHHGGQSNLPHDGLEGEGREEGTDKEYIERVQQGISQKDMSPMTYFPS